MPRDFIVQEVTNNATNEVAPMIIRENAKIGEGAFGTVIEALLKPVNPTSDTTNTQSIENINNNNNNNSDNRDNNNNSIATDQWTGPYAIKKVPAHTEYKSRELEILRGTSHPNVVALKYFYNYPNNEDDNKLYQHLVMESLPCTLQSEIKRYHNSKLILHESHIQVYTFQLARGMNYLHSFGICHRDIKPSNILINPDTLVLKICDFGSAKKLEPNQPSVSYICSRYYRAPELIVGCTVYTTQIDIWGLGCVLGEMYMGKPVFQGQDPSLQLREISKLLGPPEKSFIFESNPNYNGPTYSHKLYTSKPSHRFAKVFTEASPYALDLLMKILVYKPRERLIPRQIMAHQFFHNLRLPNFRVIPRTKNDKIDVRNYLFNLSHYELQTLNEEVQNILPFGSN
ncbi:hypothetical protein BVG19_g417 [[Candida] boidinii]|nr:hypothetical protein BVG19_g417 [[Candida] boidinii]OWB50210.1 protein serine/threonine kinase activity protein [[Candida] boidinii]